MFVDSKMITFHDVLHEEEGLECSIMKIKMHLNGTSFETYRDDCHQNVSSQNMTNCLCVAFCEEEIGF